MTEPWFYTNNGEKKGPVPILELQQLAASGQLQPTDLVGRPGMHLWIPAADARALFRAARPELPPVPAPQPLQAIPVEPVAGPPRPTSAQPVGRPVPRPPPPRRMSTGAKVALFGGLAGVAVLILIVVLAVALSRRGRTPSGSYEVNLNQGAKDVRDFHFTSGRQVTIRVTSDLNTDVDLYVFDPFNNLVALDNGPQKDCFVNFRAPATGVYRVEIVNLGPGFNHAIVRYN
jgi:hypothetical protein